jgi:hypothetical protein
MRIQGLDPQPRSLIWWIVGAAPFFQLEFFRHTRPQQRPLPADWQPCDLGLVRFGIEVQSFDSVAGALARWNIVSLAPVSGSAGSRRLAFRDPFIGIIVEVIENTASAGPLVSYAASSLADLPGARRFYGEVIGASIEPLENLRQPCAESLWGLRSAVRDGFLARIGERFIEVIAYREPLGRPHADSLHLRPGHHECRARVTRCADDSHFAGKNSRRRPRDYGRFGWARVSRHIHRRCQLGARALRIFRES